MIEYESAFVGNLKEFTEFLINKLKRKRIYIKLAEHKVYFENSIEHSYYFYERRWLFHKIMPYFYIKLVACEQDSIVSIGVEIEQEHGIFNMYEKKLYKQVLNIIYDYQTKDDSF